MNSARIAVRYARALFDLALESNAVDGVYGDMKALNRICSMDEVKDVISNPVIPQQKRKDVIIALAGSDASKLTVDFISLMFSHGRGDYLAAAARNFIDLTRRHRGIRQVTVTTAVPVDDETKKEVKGVNFCSCFVVFTPLHTKEAIMINFYRGFASKKEPS